MPQLDFSTWIGQIFWLIFTFTIMYILMTILVLPRMKNISDQRQQKISRDFKCAEELDAEAEIIAKDAQSYVTNAQNEADAILAAALEEAAKVIEQQVIKANKESDKKVSEALKNIEKQKSVAVGALDSVVFEVATDTLSRVVAVKNPRIAVEAKLLKKS